MMADEGVKYMATTKPRFSITLEEETMDAVEFYRYKNRIVTRSEAAVRLIEIALDRLMKEEDYWRAFLTERNQR